MHITPDIPFALLPIYPPLTAACRSREQHRASVLDALSRLTSTRDIAPAAGACIVQVTVAFDDAHRSESHDIGAAADVQRMEDGVWTGSRWG